MLLGSEERNVRIDSRQRSDGWHGRYYKEIGESTALDEENNRTKAIVRCFPVDSYITKKIPWL